MNEKKENSGAIDNEYAIKHEDIKEAFKNACKIVFDDDILINDIQIKDKIMIVNYSILNNRQHICILNTTKSSEDNMTIFGNDINYEIEELIHHLQYKNDKWQSNIEGFCE